MNITFEVKNQSIYRTDSNRIVADSKNYLYASFHFETDDWKSLVKTAIFKKGKNSYSVILDDNDSCIVPWEVIKTGRVLVSVFGGNLITTDVVEIYISESGYEEGVTPTEPTPDVYQQILDKLENLQAGEISDEQISKAINEYLAENPISGVDEAEVQRIVAEYVEAHKGELKGEKGDKGDPGVDGKDGVDGVDGTNGVDGKSAYDIAVDNGFEGTQAEWLESLKGEDGKDGNGSGGGSINAEDVLPLVYPKVDKIVDVDGTYGYSTLNSALSEAINGETILVLKGEYFTQMICDKDVTIIGIDKENVVLWNDNTKKGYYPLDAKKGTYKNLTFKSIYNEENRGEISWEYAVHIDSVDTSNDTKQRVIRFENCSFYSECAPAVGMGHSANMTIEFVNCDFETKLTDLENGDLGGAFYIHLPIIGTQGGGQELFMQNCRILSNSAQSALIDLRADCRCTFINNTFATSYNGGSTAIGFASPTITPSCHGNNVALLNYIPCESIALNTNSVTMREIGETVTLSVTKTPSNSAEKILWKSNDESIVTVENGVITAVAEGMATITVKCGNATEQTCGVNVVTEQSNSLQPIRTIDGKRVAGNMLTIASQTKTYVYECNPNSSYVINASGYGNINVADSDRNDDTNLIGIGNANFSNTLTVTTNENANYLYVSMQIDTFTVDAV